MLPSTNELSELSSVFNQPQTVGFESNFIGQEQQQLQGLAEKGTFQAFEMSKQKPQNEQNLTATETGQSELDNLQREN